MKLHSRIEARGAAPRFGTVVILLAALTIGLTTGAAQADGLVLRKGVAVGENGFAARSLGGVTNGEGQGAFRRGAIAADGQGNGVAGFGACANGHTGSACRGGSAGWNADGSFTRNLGTETSGENGFVSSRRSLSRDAEGNLTGARSLDAAGNERAYTGAASLADGTYNRDATYTGTEGQSATVDSTYTRGTGGTRSVTCIDASGAVVSCP